MIEENFIIEKENNVKVYCYYFIPEDRRNIKGIIQIIHGFGEHAMRYKEFASVLVNNGYAVCTLDNRGHGKTAIKNQNQKMGHVADSNGTSIMLEDLHDLMEKSKSDFGSNLHYTLFGHSFGSFLARAFAIKYPSEVNALVLSATKSDKNFIDGVGHFIVRLQKGLFGSRATSPFMHSMSTGGYAKKYFPEDCNNAAWLTSDKTEQLKFLEDQYCFKTPASTATYVEMLNILTQIAKKENINKMRKDLPILLVSGEEDILGDFGKGIEKLYKIYTNLGLTNVTKKIYKGLRHEILNEKDKLSVTNDIVDWIKTNTKNASPNLEKTKNIFKDFATSTKKDEEQKEPTTTTTISNSSLFASDTSEKELENKNEDKNESINDNKNENNGREQNDDVTTISIDKTEENAVIEPTAAIIDEPESASTEYTIEPASTTETSNDISTDTSTIEPESESKDISTNADDSKSEPLETTTTVEKNDTDADITTDTSTKKATTASTKKSTPKKEATAKKSTVKKETTAKKSTSSKKTTTTSTKKTTAAKKSTPKKETAAKKSTAKKETTAKKTAATKKTTTTSTKKTTAAKKSTPKKETAAKKSTAKKSTK